MSWSAARARPPDSHSEDQPRKRRNLGGRAQRPADWDDQDVDRVVSWLTDPAFHSRIPNKNSKRGGRLTKLVKILITSCRYIHERLQFDFVECINFLNPQAALKDPIILLCVEDLAGRVLSRIEQNECSVVVSTPEHTAPDRTYSRKWDSLSVGERQRKQTLMTINVLQMTPELMRVLKEKVIERDGKQLCVLSTALVEDWLINSEGLEKLWSQDHLDYTVRWCKEDYYRLPSGKENRVLRLSNLLLNSCKIINGVIDKCNEILALEKSLIDDGLADDCDVLLCGNTQIVFCGQEHKRIKVVRSALLVHLASQALYVIDDEESDEDELPRCAPHEEPDDSDEDL